MKTIHLKSIFLLLALSFFFTNCTDDNRQIPAESFIESSIFGIVTDKDDEPIKGAFVTFNGLNTETDIEGIYRFDNVEIGSQHNSVKIEKEGFFENARTFRSKSSALQYQRTILQESLFSQSFQSTSEETVSLNRVSIYFPSNSIVVEETSEVYNGEVFIAIQDLDPTEDRLSELMPGDLSASGENNSISTLESFGMVHVEMRSLDGAKLQIADGKNVEMSYRVSDELLSQAPDVIDMWSFDFNSGLWIQEGQASLNGNTYTGLVSHFSSWNYDVKSSSVIVSGQILARGQSLAYYHVLILNADNKGGRGSTDSEGKFSGRVEADTDLILRIYSFDNCYELLYEENVGSFAEDTDLGIITVQFNAEEFVFVSGAAVDCDFDPVVDGRVRLNNSVFPIVEGEINFVSQICDETTIDLTITDAVNLQQTILANLAVPGDQNLGQVEVCGTAANFLRIDNLEDAPLILSENLFFNHYTSSTDDVIGTIAAHVIDNERTTTMEMFFYMGSAFSMVELEEREYALIGGVFHYQRNNDNATYKLDQSGTITVESISINAADEKEVIGKYEVACKEQTTQEQKVITGAFKMVYQ